MRSVKKWRYFCDFCKKTGGSAPHMAKHERGCTLNPQRRCRHCELMNGGPGEVPLADLIAMLPDPAKFVVRHEPEDLGFGLGEIPAYDTPDDDALRDAVHIVLPKLRDAANQCPTCIFAALRQRGIPVPVVTDFNYTTELASMWSDINSEREDARGYYHY